MTELERRLARGRKAPELDPERIAARLKTRARAEGLLDVAYASIDSPLGELLVATTPRGLVRLAYVEEAAESVLEELAERLSPRVLRAPERTDEVRRQLEEYFAHERSQFDTPIDWSLVRGFAADVLRATARVPFGTLTTYRDVASAAGSPRAYRAAGNALGANPIPIVVPCHRVVHAGGGLGGYTGGLDRKRFLLVLEGARLGGDRGPALPPQPRG
jgi:methylated-DNA-[protein]-cysteine S-methyltransferase